MSRRGESVALKKSSSEIVLEAIKDLHAQEQVVTRETLADLTELKLTIIDDRLSYLIDSGAIHRIQRGVFVPAPEHKPARLVSKMVLPGGTVKIEVGDDVLTLTPRENRMLAELMAGANQQYASIEIGHQAAHLAAEMSLELKQVRRELHEMRDLLDRQE